MLREVEGGRARRVQSVQRRRQTRRSLPASRPRKAVFESLSSSEAAVELRPNKFLMNSSGLFSVLSTIFFLTEKRSEEHTSELQSHLNLVCRLLLEKKK